MTFVSLISSFVITSASLFLLRPVACRLGLVDIPGGRKTHINPTPLVGGLGIYLGTLLMCLLTPSVFQQYSDLLALSFLVLFVGMVDDAKELRVAMRMGLHTLAALLMAGVANVRLESFGDIIGLGPVELGALSIPITIFATVGVINAINMSDGLDGLSGGLVLIALGFIGITATFTGNLSLLSLVGILACSISAFLMMNFRLLFKKSALIYLGDAGSTMLGFILAWLLISESQGSDPSFAPVFALWFLAIPLMDTVYLLVARPLRRLSPFTPGIDHLHHNLMARGLDVRNTVLLLYATGMAFGSIGVFGIWFRVDQSFMFLSFMALFLLYIYIRQLLRRAPAKS